MDLKKALSLLVIIPAAAIVLPAFVVGVAAYREAFRKAVSGRGFDIVVYPPDWQSTLAGVALALIAFLVALYGLRRLVNLGLRLAGHIVFKKRKASEYPSWPD